MKQHKLAKIITFVFLCVASFGMFSAPLTFAADNICNNKNIPEEIRASSGCKTSTAIDEPGAVVGRIISTVVGILGLVAVIFVVIGGVQYMTSAGDPGKVKKAKDTILYAVIGLVICTLAFAITQFAIGAINGNLPQNYATSADCKKAGYTWNSKTETCE